jgi:hypothetical protein
MKYHARGWLGLRCLLVFHFREKPRLVGIFVLSESGFFPKVGPKKALKFLGVLPMNRLRAA